MIPKHGSFFLVLSALVLLSTYGCVETKTVSSGAFPGKLNEENRKYTDEELKGMSYYQIQMINKENLNQDQKVIAKKITKNNRYDDCIELRDEYFEMSYDELLDIEGVVKSKSQDIMYRFILSNKGKEANLNNKFDPAFSVINKATGGIEFRTKATERVSFTKTDCPFSRLNWKQVEHDKGEKWYVRGSVSNDNTKFIQLYLVKQTPSNLGGTIWHHGINRAVSSSLGDLSVTKIDLEHVFERNLNKNTYYSHLGFDLTLEQIEKLYAIGRNEPIEIYSRTGVLKVEVPFIQIESFYEGIQNNKLQNKF